MQESGVQPADAPVEQGKASVFEDIVDIFVAPRRVFERHHGGRYGAALLVLILLTAILTFATYSIFEPIMRATVEAQLAALDQGNMTPEQVEAARSVAQGFARYGFLLAPVMTAVAVFLIGFVIWLIGKLFGSAQTVGAAIAASVFSWYPRLIETIVTALQARFTSDASDPKTVQELSLTLARFMDPTAANPAVLTIASRIGVFPIWTALLMFIAFQVTGRLSPGRAAAAAAIVWIVRGFLGG